MAKSTFGKGAELLELESVQRAIDESATWAGQEYSRRLRGATRALMGMRMGGGWIESPIEAIFYAWFGAVESLESSEVYHFGIKAQDEVTVSNGKTYRFDFTIQFGPQDVANKAHERGIPQPKVAIELDGHDFHERTKEQVAYRNERDRDAQADGWTILHFSGSELYRDPVKAAQSVLDLCVQKHNEWSSVVWGVRIGN